MSQTPSHDRDDVPAGPESSERFRLIYQLAPIGIAQVSLETGRILEVNDKLCQIVGHTPDQLVGRLMSDLVRPADWEHEKTQLDRLTAGDIDSYRIEKRYLRVDGTEAWVRVIAARVEEAGVPPFRLSIVEDITEQKRAEQALLEREGRLRAIVETAADAIITMNERGQVDSVNSAAERLFGYTRDEIIGQNVNILMPQPDRTHHDRYLRDYLRTGEAAIIGRGREVMARRKDGSTFPVHLAVNEAKLPTGRLFTGILHDLSARRKLETLVTEASAREQQRIGQDLHDGLGQQLAGLSFFCKSLVTRLESHASPEAADARRMNELITAALHQARGLSRGLNPIASKRDGLASALQELAGYVRSTFGVPCRFEQLDPVEIDDASVATHAYRIAQEAVTNAVKHARPRNVTITLGFDRGQVGVTVEDDGTGLPAEPTGGSGREIMRARAAILGGTLDVVPGRAGGTLVRCRFPQPPLKESPS